MKYVYLFNEGNKDMKDILGGKGANLAEMTRIGLPVPLGFTVTTDACNNFYENKCKMSTEIKNEIFEKLKEFEKMVHKKFGSKGNPLLVSVRSGSPVSMPGMMDTILNLGLNDEVAESLSNKTGNKRFVYDSYRRLIGMYADVVKGLDTHEFEKVIDTFKKKRKIKLDIDLNEDDMYKITLKYKEIYEILAKEPFPQNPYEQLIEAVTSVFKSWNNERAKIYRKMNDISDSLGTAVNVQEMVYGNLGSNSGTGVAFTRNPSTGEKELYGEYLMNAQGEDVVAGIRTPKKIETLKKEMPDVYEEFNKYCEILENHYKDMQDMEFTIENGKLYMLQTRNGKRTAKAAIKIAVDLVNEKKISKKEALLRVEPNTLDQLLHKTFDEKELKNAHVIAKGLSASPGASSGKILFNAADVIKAKNNNEEAILVRNETSPEDIEGMSSASGVLTIRGGMTSHAAVVARGMGKCCVSGCEDLTINESDKTLTTKDGFVFSEGDIISIDGTTGLVYEGEIKKVESATNEYFNTFMSWADSVRKLGVRANAETVADATQAKKFGAEGIGLCRTEHMFFSERRIFSIRKMIMSKTDNQRQIALNELLIYQREDFEQLFRIIDGDSITIRYLDPPLHEFLPKEESEIKKLAKSLDMSYNELVDRIDELKEFNPMMGHRGCRLAVTNPEVARMQTRALIEAAINVTREGIKVKPEIMIPLVTDLKEFKFVKKIVDDEASIVMKEQNQKIDYKIGTMIETPRAVMMSQEIAEEAKFFSFGTNDLTQLSFGFSRDDASKYLNDYLDKKILEYDPFKRIDENGVGRLVEIAVRLGKKARKNLHLGICGEHAGEANSIYFCHKIGLDYVSCSPYRVPIARLAAAQAAIKARKD